MLAAEIKYYAQESMFHGFVPRIMGTRFDLLLVGADPIPAERLWMDISDELERLDKLLNRFDPLSEVSRVNATAGRTSIAVSPELATVLRLCAFYYESTEHLFDVTRRDFAQIDFSASGDIRFGDPTLSLDFGGFAKGYALRKIAAMLRGAGIGSAFVDFGNSSILGVGRHPYGTCWKVGLENPYTQASLAEFCLEDRALSTSGNLPQYTGHIVDPRTGVGNRERKFAAVVSRDPLDAEVLSTVWMIADTGQRERIARNFENMQGFLYML